MKIKFFLIAGTIVLAGIQQQAAAQTVTGSGTANYVSKFTAASVIANSQIYDNGTNVGINTGTTPAFKLHVKTAAANDGIRIEQTGTNGAVLSLNNTSAGGKNYSLFSTGSSNTQGGAGHFMLYDYSASQTRLFVQGGTGYVGIGTYQPLDMLHMPSGKARLGDATNYLQLANNTTYQELIATGNMTLKASTAGMSFMTNNVLRMFITQSGTGAGRVGINTTAPDVALHVYNGSMKLTGTDPVHGAPNIFWGGTPSVAPNGEWALEYNTADPAKKGMNFWRPFGATGGAGTGNYFLFLGDNGNVGVGTNNPTAKLTVNGKVLIGDPGNAALTMPGTYGLYVETGILTSKVRIASVGSANWADYVFDDRYELKSLSAVNSFIKANKHLPGVPSASQVEKEGVDLLQMNIKLLEKVEELTLYLIQQEERIKSLEAEKQK